MLVFVAIGPKPEQRWRRRLPSGQVVRLGRAPVSGWAVPWDLRISREHVDMELRGDSLEVRRLEQARNPVYRLGERQERFSIRAGEDFRIGLTTFRIDEVPEGEVTGAPEVLPPAEVAALKAQVKALQDQLHHQRGAGPSAPPEEASDEEILALREQVQRLKARMSGDEGPSEDKDREIESLRLQLAAMKQGGDAMAPERHPPPPAQQPPPSAKKAPPAPAAAPPRQAPRRTPEKKPQAPPPRNGAAAPAKSPANEGRSPDLKDIKRRLEEKLRERRADSPEPSRVAETVKPRADRRISADAGGRRDRPVKEGEATRRSTLYVLKAQIEAQAAAMRAQRRARRGGASSDSRQSDIEALKGLLEKRVSERREQTARELPTDSILRTSDIDALAALHSARLAGQGGFVGEVDSAELIVLSDSSAAWVDSGPIDLDDTESIAPNAASARALVWLTLPKEARAAAEEIAAGYVVADEAKEVLLSALNRLMMSRAFIASPLIADLLASSEAAQRLAALGVTGDRRDWSELNVRIAARLAIESVFAGAIAPFRPAGPLSASQPCPGELVGAAEAIAGRSYATTCVAGGAADSPAAQVIEFSREAIREAAADSPGFREALDGLRDPS